MKIWRSYSSEHSMNLVMIGRFKNAADASEAKKLMDLVAEEVAKGAQIDDDANRFQDGMLDFLIKHNVSTVGPAELAQFGYDISVELKDAEIRVSTDEIEVSAFMKILLNKGARIEVFSAQDYPEKTGESDQ